MAHNFYNEWADAGGAIDPGHDVNYAPPGGPIYSTRYEAHEDSRHGPTDDEYREDEYLNAQLMRIVRNMSGQSTDQIYDTLRRWNEEHRYLGHRPRDTLLQFIHLRYRFDPASRRHALRAFRMVWPGVPGSEEEEPAEGDFRSRGSVAVGWGEAQGVIKSLEARLERLEQRSGARLQY
jgi:hypothetical protein